MTKSEEFDQAFTNETGMDVLTRILGCFDVDFFSEYKRGIAPSHYIYTVRVWDQGEPIVECSGTDLENVLAAADTYAGTSRLSAHWAEGRYYAKAVERILS